MYGTNDQQQYDLMGGKGENNYGRIKSLVVLSTDDMQNWTYHGQINVDKIATGSWFGVSWAPSIVSREESDGLTHFYMYFSNGGSVGLLTATHPLGPWKDPLGKSFVNSSTPGVGDCSNPFDPGVCIDDEGTGWLAFGGGSINKTGTDAQPGNARIVKLGSDMKSLASKASEIRAPYQFEASELNVIGGELVYTYCSRWSDPNASCSMNYMVCDQGTSNPLDTASWRYVGNYVKNPGTFGFGYGNNHTHLHKYRGTWYIIYHNLKLINASGNTEASGFRSLGINTMSVSESSQKLYSATMNSNGPSKLQDLDPYRRHSATEMRTGVGVSFANHPDYAVKKDTLRAVLTDVQDGAWVALKSVAFTANGASRFTIRVKGTGSVSLQKNSATPTTANTLGTVTFSGLKDFTDVSIDLSHTKVRGTVTLYLVFSNPADCQVESWEFEPYDSGSGIEEMPAADCVEAESVCYNLSGQRICGSRLGQLAIVGNRLCYALSR